MPRKARAQVVEQVSFKVHPRAFEALGRNLVTSDIVAVLELVKNSYDAWATRADIRFVEEDDGTDLCLEIQDNGDGMSRKIIEEAWCVAATPYRTDRPINRKGNRVRRVSGEKGLGRLSAMRLGRRLRMFTRRSRTCWEVAVDWEALAGADDLSECSVELRKCSQPPFRGTGTLVRITQLAAPWDEEKIEELEDRLGRLISPFGGSDDFAIAVAHPGHAAQTARIEIPAHLDHPPYALSGSVDAQGNVNCRYVYSPPEGRGRKQSLRERLRPQEDRQWPWVGRGDERPACGPLEFEFRAWSYEKDELQEYADVHSLTPRTVRQDIELHCGLSVYRDGVLVLPKTDAGRDWLGLDRRRVSHVGRRIDSKQIISQIVITAKDNPGIRDTSDRERLADNDASEDFRALLLGLVDLLERERQADRRELRRQRPFKELLEGLSPARVLRRVQDMAAEGLAAKDVVPVIESYGADVLETTGQIEERLVYYSRLATVGSLAAMIVHEVRGHAATLGKLIRLVGPVTSRDETGNRPITQQLALAESALRSLERLADRFAPLATVGRRTRRRDSVVEKVIADCVAMREKAVRTARAEFKFGKKAVTRVAVDPGELMAVFINLLDNSLYWLSQSDTREPQIAIAVTRQAQRERATVRFHDNGPGVEPGYEERVFWPGVTRKPGGIGMGLTVAAEIVSQYGGRMYLDRAPKLGGATFGFDIPLSRRSA